MRRTYVFALASVFALALAGSALAQPHMGGGGGMGGGYAFSPPSPPTPRTPQSLPPKSNKGGELRGLDRAGEVAGPHGDAGRAKAEATQTLKKK